MGTVTLTPNCYTSNFVQYYHNSGLPLSYVGPLTAPKLAKNALLDYTVPNVLSNVTITSVTLSYTLNNWNGNLYYLRKTKIRPVTFNVGYLANIDDTNYNGFVTAGTGITDTENYTPTASHAVIKNITSIFQNNISNGKFQVDITLDAINSYDPYPANTVDNAYLFIAMPPTITVTYDDIVPTNPIITQPNEQYFNNTDSIEFDWIYTTTSPYPQYSATIEWKLSTDSNYTQVILTQSATSYTFNAGTFPTGTIEWRIKTTDTGGNVSGWSYAKFVVKSRPNAPIITDVANNAITEIKWNSAEQTGYEMYLYKGSELIHSEKVNSINKSYKPNFLLGNATYTFVIKVKNSFNLWSENAIKMFTISAVQPSKPTIQTFANKDKVTIMFSSSTPTNYIYRVVDGKETCIGVSSPGTFVDKEPELNKINKYFVRAYSAGYTDSDTTITRPFCEGFVLSNSNISVNLTRSMDKFMPYSLSKSRGKAYNNYVGREYPVRELSEFKEQSIKRTCFATEEQAKKLFELAESDEVILYRDSRGNKIYCDLSIDDLKNEMLDTGYEVGITVTRISHEEGVAINV